MTSLRTLLFSPEREQTGDLLKGFAVIFMVLIHLIENMATHEVETSWFGQLCMFLGGPPAAPVFMAVMGYYLLRPQPRAPRYYITRGLVLFSGGMLLNVGLNFNLLISIYSGRFDLNPYEFLFGVDILHFAGLSIVTIGLISIAFKRNLLAYFALAVLVAAIGSRIPEFATTENSILSYANAFLWGDFDWSYFPLFPWLAYPLLGISFRLATEKFAERITSRKTISLIGAATLVALMATSYEYAISSSANLPFYYHHDLLFAIWTFVFLFGWTATCSELDDTIGKTYLFLYVKWLGKNVTSVFVFQWLLIGNLSTEFYRTQNWPAIPLWFIGVLTMTTILTATWRKLKRLRHLRATER